MKYLLNSQSPPIYKNVLKCQHPIYFRLNIYNILQFLSESISFEFIDI